MGLLLDTLNSVDFLSGMGEDAVVRFMVLGRSADYSKAHVFWRAGGACQGLVVPVSGEAKLATRGPDGREFIESFRGPGECMGLSCTLDGLPHASDAIVVRAGEFFAIRPDGFRQFAREFPDVWPAAVRLMGRQLRRNLQEREDIALRPVSERLAQFLIENACVRQTSGAKVLIEATQSEVAARLGTVREVVARVFADLARRGLIERSKDGIFIVDWDGLHAVAGVAPGDIQQKSSVYSPSPTVRTARFFLPTTEKRTSRERDSDSCAKHIDDFDACRAAGCPGSQKSSK
jgi:CRP/FNR family transcriptional regulator